ncbi:MAG: prolipoprotein diacylglyceryl transferase [Clostridia bacterium]|nr:prolipoprotein diacylglyceryl transferase [Clostridia bacterium]
MLPNIHIMGFHIPMYSLMLAVGGVAYVIVLLVTFTRFEKVQKDTVRRLILVSVIGAGALAVSAFIFDSIFHSIQERKLVMGGITWLGGVVGAVPAMIALLHFLVPEAKGRALYFFSLLMPGLVLAHAFGRIGCFFGGCCYGMPTDSWLGIRFPDDSHAAAHVIKQYGANVAVLPTMLIEAIFELILFIVMMATRKKTKKYNIEIYAIAYGVFRFIMEFFRGDNRGGTGFFLTPSQFLSVILWISAVFLILYRNGKILKNLPKKCETWQEEFKLDLVKKKEDRRCCATISATSAIREVHKLYEEGVLSKEEYERTKAKLLERIE